MRAYNSLFTDLTCPHCHKTVDVEIELRFGDVGQFSYVLGDTYNWLPEQRPQGGNWDGEGVETCPQCGRVFTVTVEIRNDIISAIIHQFNPQDEEMEDAKPEKKPGNPPVNPGKIDPGSQWNLTPVREAALQRLAELGVTVYSLGGDDYTLMIPYGLPADHYLDIGYLMAQLGDEVFPQGYEGLTIKTIPAQVYEQRIDGHPPVYFVDGYPQGMKYRVQPSKI